ncbi:MAG: hypothetical protein ABI601_05575 [bacterium]
MRRLIAVPRSAYVRVGIVLAALSLTACKPKDRGPDTAKSDTTATAPKLPGQLAKPIDQYTGDEFYALVQGLTWGGGVQRPRACKGDPGCDGTTPSKSTTVQVDAVDGQDSLTAIGGPADGVVAIRAVNTGSLVEDRYGFKPGKNVQYYLIVLPGTDSAGTWRLEELDTTAGARRHSSAGTGTFRPCNHPFLPKRANRANFYTCPNSRMNDTSQKAGLLLFAPLKDPLWMDCAQGCCLADG